MASEILYGQRDSGTIAVLTVSRERIAIDADWNLRRIV